jgi:hypothetical protein
MCFLLPTVEYLGHVISAEGLQPSERKVRAIKEAPCPKDITQLKSFLGLVNYYGKFIPNLSTQLAPLHKLLQKRVGWHWGKEQEEAFQNIKNNLPTAPVLTHYDPEKPLILTCDASPYGVRCLAR